MLLCGGVEGGMVHPPKGAAVVRESQDVWVCTVMNVVGDGKFDGDDGGDELEHIYGRSAAEFRWENKLPSSALHGDSSQSPGAGVGICRA